MNEQLASHSSVPFTYRYLILSHSILVEHSSVTMTATFLYHYEDIIMDETRSAPVGWLTPATPDYGFVGRSGSTFPVKEAQPVFESNPLDEYNNKDKH